MTTDLSTFTFGSTPADNSNWKQAVISNSVFTVGVSDNEERHLHS